MQLSPFPFSIRFCCCCCCFGVETIPPANEIYAYIAYIIYVLYIHAVVQFGLLAAFDNLPRQAHGPARNHFSEISATRTFKREWSENTHTQIQRERENFFFFRYLDWKYRATYPLADAHDDRTAHKFSVDLKKRNRTEKKTRIYVSSFSIFRSTWFKFSNTSIAIRAKKLKMKSHVVSVCKR